MAKVIVTTNKAPAAIGPYSQAVKVGTTVYMSGQIPLLAETMEMVSDDFRAQAEQVFKNLAAVCEAAGGELQDMVKLQIYLTNLGQFTLVNEVMSSFFAAPYPARAAIEVSALPKGAQIEIDGVMELPSTN
ncbi:Rid family detoxifying hydrolase [Aliidiomarina quisquiliarum]|uniref:Rid family detoxifying hydrolase n=1 Tax=Aliidiomarina quisquiliarum TaxID=2938947 RepID=UPI00208E08AA|nr:Rid family detoxifying hydrolase [Aliidiomarina quisquiliarum]MCO4321066.1 Rid family detoxifying hydrolase [Aliidiomarina quisquiliarum]